MPVENNRPKFWKLFCLIGGGILILFAVIVFILVFWFFRSSLKSYENTKTPKPDTANSAESATNFPLPQSCSQLATPDAEPVAISTKNPGLKEDTDTNYYQIYGSTEADLRSQMTDCGPKEGGSYDAYTAYYVNWNYNLKPGTNDCALQDVVVGVKVDFYYPKWDATGDYQAGLKEKWQTYMRALDVHENGHKQNMVDGAQEIFQTLSNFSALNCQTAKTQADEKAYGILDNSITKDKAYDKETSHGATQGAVFP